MLAHAFEPPDPIRRLGFRVTRAATEERVEWEIRYPIVRRAVVGSLSAALMYVAVTGAAPALPNAWLLWPAVTCFLGFALLIPRVRLTITRDGLTLETRLHVLGSPLCAYRSTRRAEFGSIEARYVSGGGFALPTAKLRLRGDEGLFDISSFVLWFSLSLRERTVPAVTRLAHDMNADAHRLTNGLRVRRAREARRRA